MLNIFAVSTPSMDGYKWIECAVSRSSISEQNGNKTHLISLCQYSSNVRPLSLTM